METAAETREAVDEHAEEGAVAQARKRREVDAVEQGSSFCGGEDRSLAGLDDVFGSAHRCCGIEGEDLADDEPVEEHAQRGQVLLDARSGKRARELLDVGGDHHGLHLVEREATTLAPVGEAPDGSEVGEPGIGIADMGGEELPEAALGVGGGGEEHRRRRAVGGQGRARGAFGGEEVGEHGGDCRAGR